MEYVVVSSFPGSIFYNMGDINLFAFFLSTHSLREPTNSKRNNDSRMATIIGVQRSYQRWSLDELSTELLVLILEQLKDVDPRSLGIARLVSTRFNAIVTPMKYHTIRMTQYIVDPRAETFFPGGIANICAHTRHVKVDSDLNAEHIKRVLDKLERLSSISWRYVQDELCKGDFWVPSDILPLRHIQSGKVRLYIENLPLQDFRSELYNPYLRAIPTGILVSLMTATPTRLLTARVESLKGLLLESPRLETFRYDDRGQGTQFGFSGNERLPAFKELSLRSYHWNHSSTTVLQHWDFSRIRRLEMIDVPLGPFLNSVCFADFQHLDTLRLDDFSAHPPNRRPDTTRGQYLFIKQIRALIDLKITCHIPSFPIDGILQHARSIRSLRFRDYTGFTDEHHRCPTVRVEDLDTMSRELVNLRTIELDMDERCCEPHHFLRTLCNFRQLNALTLHIQTALDPLQDTDANIDLDYGRAMQILSLLVQGKQAALWHSITINVGGWKPIMMRRFSAPWRELYSRGLYAERCFVMEKQESGALEVREELPIRAS
ncbi:F-box domain-containing protein [Xylaria acuta]|nr:F-box domain-containing protein [Xylaria acuta]